MLLCEADDRSMLLEYTSLHLTPSLSIVSSQGPCIEGVTMHSWLVTVVLLCMSLLLATVNNSRGQGTKGAWGGGRTHLIMCSCMTSGGSGLSYTCVVFVLYLIS